jgi:hypothetical protein
VTVVCSDPHRSSVHLEVVSLRRRSSRAALVGLSVVRSAIPRAPRYWVQGPSV